MRPVLTTLLAVVRVHAVVENIPTTLLTDAALETDVELSQGEGTNGKNQVTFFAGADCGGMSVTFDEDSAHTRSFCEGKFPGGSELAKTFRQGNNLNGQVSGSVFVSGTHDVEIFDNCECTNYVYTTMPLDGCVNIYRWPGVLGFKFKASALQIKQDYKQPT